jgi:outer membrane protein OmpA-like peptidoglycan-associated protein
MKSPIKTKITIFAISLAAASATAVGWSAELNTATFSADHKTKIQGVILSHDGDSLKVRTDSDSVAVIDLTGSTKIQLKRGTFSNAAMSSDALVPGLEIKAEGKGNEKGELVAKKVSFDPNSMRVSHSVDARFDPLAARTGALEARAGALENRATQIETAQGQLSDQEKQTQQQVGQVQTKVAEVDTKADRANQGVDTVNQRLANLDSYKEKYMETVYFKTGSALLSAVDKQKLDSLVQQAKSEKGYALEIDGFADTTGNVAYNQQLSDRRANAVRQYLAEHSDIPIYRMITPAGLGTTHAVADNRTSAGRKLNRRVEVKVLVNEGIGAGATQTASLP